MTDALTRDELARALGLPRAAVDALVGAGREDERVQLQTIERALQGLVQRVQQIAAQSAPGEESEELRRSPRYVPRRHIVGIFGKVKFSILQISRTGLRIRHEMSVLPGERGRITFAIGQPPQSFPMAASVIWTSIASRGQGPTVCISGLRIVENVERLDRAVDLLLERGELEPSRATGRKGAPKTPAALRGISDEEVAATVSAVRHLTADPVEANRWYQRARYAAVDEEVRKQIQQLTRDREQILAVWELLERKVELPKVAAVMAWMRSTRASAV